VYQGRTLQFSATVEGDENTDQSVTWSISTKGIALGTTISEGGLLGVAVGETKTSIEVKAVSTVYTNKSGTRSIAIIVETDENNLDFGLGAEITTIDVTSLEQWTAAINTITNGGNDKNYIINVNDDITGLTGVTAVTFGTTTTGIKVSLRGTGSLELGSNGSLIYLGLSQTLVLRDITLKGKADNDNAVSAVVYMLGSSSSEAIQPVFIMESGEICGNSPTGSSRKGGGVHNEYGTFTMHGGKISNNTISGSGGVGGGVYNLNATFTMTGGEISDNTAYGSGGGVYSQAGTSTMTGGKISGNQITANTSYGAGVYSSVAFTMSDGEISNNTGSGSSSQGGGVYATEFTMSGGVISGNSARSGCGVIIPGGGGATFTMTGGKISNNFTSSSSASSYGGGVYIMASTFTMAGGEISGNSNKNGGGVCGSTSTFIMEGGTISGNAATTGGGVNCDTVYKYGGTVYGNGEGDNSNTATGGDTKGHAVYVSATKYRNATAGTGVNLNSATSGGWITN
jgi:hypothetical protein